MSLTKEQILATKDRPCKKVSIPDWGIVYLRPFTGADKDDWDAHIDANTVNGEFNPFKGARTLLVTRCLCSESGERLFDDGEEDVLNKALPGNVMERLFDEARNLNDLGVKDAEDDTAADAGEA